MNNLTLLPPSVSKAAPAFPLTFPLLFIPTGGVVPLKATAFNWLHLKNADWPKNLRVAGKSIAFKLVAWAKAL